MREESSMETRGEEVDLSDDTAVLLQITRLINQGPEGQKRAGELSNKWVAKQEQKGNQ
jgi:hypothetical protein